MASTWLKLTLSLLCTAACTVANTIAISHRYLHHARQAALQPHNDFSCRSSIYPNPIILVHGVLATYYEDLNRLDEHLKNLGFCTFSTTYGGYTGQILAGGLRSISDSSAELATFIEEVASRTGARRVELVGHSEGAFQTLYVPKLYPEVRDLIKNVFAIAPPTHGTTLSGIYNLAYVGGQPSRKLTGGVLTTVGCGACNDLGPDGPAVVALTYGPIAQRGIRYTIVTSTHDEVITPPDTAFVHEPGVTNTFIQECCPEDVSGHIAESYDPNIWALLVNTLLYGQAYCPQRCTTGPGPVDTVVEGVGRVLKDPSIKQAGSTGSDILGSLEILKL